MATVRIRDVAQGAGFSTATVSMVLNGSPRISEATSQKVRRVVEELNYVPNASAQTLTTRRSSCLGLIVGDVANPFFGALAAAVQRAARSRGYDVILCNADEDPAVQDRYLADTLARRKVDGMMVASAAGLTTGLERAIRASAPIVLVDRPVVFPEDLEGGAPLVRADGSQALTEAVAHLADRGHQRFCVLAGPLDTAVGAERLTAVRDALGARGLPEPQVVETDFRPDLAEDGLALLLSGIASPTAVIACGDLIALGGLRAIRRAGLGVPRNVSLIGYDDMPWTELMDPPLSVIEQPVSEIAERAVALMEDVIAGRGAQDVTFACSFLPRASTGPVPPELVTQQAT